MDRRWEDEGTVSPSKLLRLRNRRASESMRECTVQKMKLTGAAIVVGISVIGLLGALIEDNASEAIGWVIAIGGWCKILLDEAYTL